MTAIGGVWPKAGSRLPAAGDLDGDGLSEIIVGATRGNEGGDASRLRVFAGANHQQTILDRTPYGSGYQDELRVGAGDMTGDGIPEILFAKGPGGAQPVGALDGETLLALEELFGNHNGAFLGADNRRTAWLSVIG